MQNHRLPAASDADIVVAGLGHLAHPLVYFVGALLPNLQVLHPQTRRAEHGHLHAQETGGAFQVTIMSTGQQMHMLGSPGMTWKWVAGPRASFPASSRSAPL